MTIQIRPEQPADYNQTEAITRDAFWNRYMPGCDEHYLVHSMRDCPAFVPALDLVAVADNAVVGNVMYMKSVLRGDDGVDREVLGLGPLTVAPAHQRTGIGGQLIERSVERARELGFRAVFLCGDPAYYSRHGFVPAKQHGIRMADNCYAAALQVRALYDDALSGLHGRYLEHEIYNVDKAAAEAFDRRFPYREKRAGTPSQQRFLQIAALREPVK